MRGGHLFRDDGIHGFWAPPAPFTPHALIFHKLHYPRMPIGCSLVWHTRVTIPPSGLLHAFGATIRSARLPTFVASLFLCVTFVFPLLIGPPGHVRIIHLLFTLIYFPSFCFTFLFILYLLLRDVTRPRSRVVLAKLY